MKSVLPPRAQKKYATPQELCEAQDKHTREVLAKDLEDWERQLYASMSRFIAYFVS